MILRKGETCGTRDKRGNFPATASMHEWLTLSSVDDARLAAARATRSELIDAHRWCERNPKGNKTRREMLAAALRKSEQAERKEAA